MKLDRGEYGLMHHQTFGKAAGREACRKGWERWQQVLALNHGCIVLHPHGTHGSQRSSLGPQCFPQSGRFRGVRCPRCQEQRSDT